MFYGVLVAAALVTMPAWAERWNDIVPKAGPMEGKRVEDLPPLATPKFSDDGNMPDPSLPSYLAEVGAYNAAAAAWHAVAHATSNDPLKLQALRGAAEAYAHAGETQKALASYGKLYDAFKTNTALERVRDDALLDAVWLQADQLGTVSDTYGLPQAEELKKRLAETDALAVKRVARAEFFGWLPGLGHAAVGEGRVAAVLLPLWAILMWAFLFALRRKEWPYAAVYALVVMGLWGSSPGLAAQAAAEKSAQERLALLDSWRPELGELPKPAEEPVPVITPENAHVVVSASTEASPSVPVSATTPVSASAPKK